MLRSAGAVGVLTTSVDQAADWIHAGQALQRVLLVASSYNVAAALHSQPLEIPLLRDFIRIHLSGMLTRRWCSGWVQPARRP